MRNVGRKLKIQNSRGVSIIAAVFLIIVLAFMGVMFLTMFTSSNFTTLNEMQSTQALYAAEGGVEYVLRNRQFPNYSMGGVMSLGSGIFTVSTPAYLTSAVAIADGTISVNSTSGFASPSGRIVIDSEVLAYTGTTANSFTGAGPATAAHANGNAIYPVTRVALAGLANNCAATDVQADYTNNFLIPGIITIGNEYLYCTGTASGPTRFTGCARCYKGSFSSAHNIGDNIFQYIVTSTGTVGNAQRAVKTGVSGSSGANIAFDDANSDRGRDVNNLTWNHRVAGADRILIVGVSIRNIAGQTVINPGGVTYNGAPLLFLGAQNGVNVRVEQWYMIAPALGNNPVSVTLAGGQTARLAAGSLSLTGVNQTNPIDAGPLFAAGNNNAPTVNINTVTDNAWVVDSLVSDTDTNANVGPGQTQRWNTNSVGGGARVRGAGSTEGPRSPAGNVTMSWVLAAARNWAIGAVALRPAAAVGISKIYWREVVN